MQEQLKNVLQNIKTNKYTLPSNVDFEQLVSNMLDNIGDIDPELRDELIYSIFSVWFIRTDLVNSKLQDILHIILNENHIFYKIGEKNTDSVFTSSFFCFINPIDTL